MKLSFKYNVAITIAIIFVSGLYDLLKFDPPSTHNAIWLAGHEIRDPASAGALIFVLSLALLYSEMLLLRSLWNNVLVEITSAREIDLSQSYALSIFLGMIVLGL